MKLTVTPLKENKRTLKLVNELPERVVAIIKTFPQEVAKETLERVKEGAPKGIEGYPDGLRVMSLPKENDWEIAGIFAPQKMLHKLRASDVKRTVLYVIPKIRGGEAVEPATVVLERENPWTMDTIPYEPKRREAEVVSRFVSEREAKAIERDRRKNLESVETELRALGVTVRTKQKVSISRKVSRDVAFEVLRYEFGIPPNPGRAHWRPALRMVIGTDLKHIFKRFEGWVAVPSDRGYKTANDLPFEKASSAKRVRRFQELVSMGLG